MIIELAVSHDPSANELPVRICVVDQQGLTLTERTIDLSQQHCNISLEFDLQDCDQNQVIDLELATSCLDIQQFPLTLEKITLDEFFNSRSLIYRGRPVYDPAFVEMALWQGWHPDATVVDSNRLDFAGQLILRYQWPFYRNVFTIYS